jgi:uncharacterized membrane-anchored protein
VNLTLRILRKVPELTIYFWIVKVLTTGMGEATSDYLVHRINPYVAVAIGAVAFVVALAVQLILSRYVASIYWLAVVMVAVFGTMAADVLHVGLGVPYVISSAFYAVALAVIFLTWHATEKTLSIHSIYTRRRELFYWATVLATFALGTAASDLTAYTLHLGFFASGILFLGAIAVPAIGYSLGWLSELLAFWSAYILTRPLGASFADWLGVPRSLSGLNLGRGKIAVSLTIVIVAFVVYLSVSGVDVEGPPRVDT